MQADNGVEKTKDRSRKRQLFSQRGAMADRVGSIVRFISVIYKQIMLYKSVL
jgi:hypothetical protein